MKRENTMTDQEFEAIIKEVELPNEDEKTFYQQGWDDGLKAGITRGRCLEWVERIEKLLGERK